MIPCQGRLSNTISRVAPVDFLLFEEHSYSWIGRHVNNIKVGLMEEGTELLAHLSC